MTLTSAEENRIAMNTEPPNVLHIYAQEFHHGDAQIVGTRDALIRLRETIDTVLQTTSEHYKVTCSAQFYANDGEGYETTVICLPDFIAHSLPMPYTGFLPRAN